MPIETRFDYISDLSPADPPGGDQLSTIDDHMRGVKNVLTNQFPSLGEVVVTAPAEDINRAAALRQGYGGMSASSQTQVINPGENKTIIPGSGAFVYDGEYVVSNGSTGIISTTGIVNDWVRVMAALSFRLDDTDSVLDATTMSARVIRVSNSGILFSTQQTQTIPEYQRSVQFTMVGLDPNPNPDESYFVQVSQGDGDALTFRMLTYNFWIEPVGR